MFWTLARYDHRRLNSSGTTSPSPLALTPSVEPSLIRWKSLESVGRNRRSPASRPLSTNRWPLMRNVVPGTNGSGPLKLVWTFIRAVGSRSLT